MSYQVLARKWRPRSFAELVGQKHVLQALINALDKNRLHHAYLFTGTRGVGKTTIARIFAKCLNCEQGVSATPCGKCTACHEIDDSRFVDLIEVDAASKTKVEDTRELLNNVQYAPTRGRYKVYLIDEVHMLSSHSFNALLKTLEEPPPHVKFLLATTDPQKLPVTVLSRCLQFSLKSMTPERIVGHLETVLSHESISYDVLALWQLALSADGSMRDALSLTDQAIAFGNGQITESDARVMLGSIDKGQVMRMIQALATNNATDILAAVAELADFSPDYFAVLDDMLSVLHRIAVAQAVPDAVDNSQGDREQVVQLAGTMKAEDVQLYYQIGLMSKKDLPLAPDARSGFEMAMLRMMAFSPTAVPLSNSPPLQASARQSTNTRENSAAMAPPIDSEPEPDPDPEISGERVTAMTQNMQEQSESEMVPITAYGEPMTPVYPSIDDPLKGQPVIVAPSVITTEKGSSVTSSAGVLKEAYIDQKLSLSNLNTSSWIAIFNKLSIGGVTGTIGSHCEYIHRDKQNIYLRLDADKSTLYNDTHRKRIEDVLSDYFVCSLKLSIEVGTIKTETPARSHQKKVTERFQQAKQCINADPVINILVKQFSGTVLEHTIKVVENNES
ncbi:MAG: DNA polymerase III subunit gamma/tau [Endozoicomonas sp. (ex Botrylloides leachii)]|nr:DNA polymerase III subunit gamma/tau [Endozoicomonas sp. (ex Botrylloides leachii)]